MQADPSILSTRGTPEVTWQAGFGLQARAMVQIVVGNLIGSTTARLEG